MAVYVLGLFLFLALATYSDASYCVCNSGLSDSVLQKNIDYACGNGADCSAINQNGACFNPNTVHDHCNYAVNSYYQKKATLQGSCDFQGTAAIVPNPPATASSTCVYPSSGSGGTTPTTPGTPTGGTVPPGSGTPTTPGAGTPTTPGTGTPTTPGTPTGTGSPLTPGTPAGTGTFPGSTTPGTPFGLGPTGSGGSGFGNTDGSGAAQLSRSSTFMLLSTMFVVLSVSAFV